VNAGDPRRGAIKRIALVTAFPFVASWTFLGVVPQLAGSGADPRTITAIAFGGVAVAEVAAVLLVRRWLQTQGRTFADLGLGKPASLRAFLLAAGAGVAFATLGLLSSFVRHNAHPDLGEVSLFRVWGVAMTAGVVPVCEEILFRGFAIDELRRAGFGTTGQLAISSIAFGSFHGLFVIQAALLGLVWGIAYLMGNRSLTPVIAGHSLNNLIAEPWFFLSIVSVQLSG
jgi:hypothetical protein